MKGGSQLHWNGLPLVPQYGAQPSLPPPLGGTCAINIHVDSWSFATSYTKKKQLLSGNVLWWLWWVVVGCGVLWCVVVCCGVLWCVVVVMLLLCVVVVCGCRVWLSCVVVVWDCCGVVVGLFVWLWCVMVCCGVLWCVVVCYGVLWCVGGVLVVCWWCVGGVGGGAGGDLCVTRGSLSCHAHSCTSFGWQNAWEQAPGVPATPSPP